MEIHKNSYLTKPFSEEELQFRAIFRWITINIAYDGMGVILQPITYTLAAVGIIF